MQIDLLPISDARIKKLERRLTFRLTSKERHAIERMLRKEQGFNAYLRKESSDAKIRQITWGLFNDAEQFEMFKDVMKNLPPSLKVMMPLLRGAFGGLL